MNHYPHHIGDFNNATRHLSRIERSVYRDLIDLYYDTEKQLTLDHAALCRLVLARSNEEATAVEQTLNEFFTETPTGWYHDRCELEIDKYRANASQKALAGKASAAAKALKAQQALNGNSTPVERTNNGTSTNRKPGTVNGKPETVNREPEAFVPAAPLQKQKERSKTLSPVALLAALGIPENLASDWIVLRKTKKAAITQTALDGIQREADKAGVTLQAALQTCCERGWAGFKAEWMNGTIRGSPADIDKVRTANNARVREEARILIFGSKEKEIGTD